MRVWGTAKSWRTKLHRLARHARRWDPGVVQGHLDSRLDLPDISARNLPVLCPQIQVRDRLRRQM